MDWFLYDRGLRHERIKFNFFKEHIRAKISYVTVFQLSPDHINKLHTLEI